jgi:hypothetical protein
LVNLANPLPDDRYRHAIVCLAEATEFRERITRADVAVYQMHKRPGQDPGTWLRLYRLFRRIGPAVVHTRNIGCLEAQIPAWLATLPCRIRGEHGWDINDPDGANARYRWLRRLHAPLVHRFIALTRELEHYLLAKVGLPACRLSRIYNGLETVGGVTANTCSSTRQGLSGGPDDVPPEAGILRPAGRVVPRSVERQAPP